MRKQIFLILLFLFLAGPTRASDITQPSGVGAVVEFGAGPSFSLADATTFFFGALFARVPTTTVDFYHLSIPVSGTITQIYIQFIQAVGASAETSSIFIRVVSTDTLISSAVINNSVLTTVNNTSLAIPVEAGDIFQMKWVTPTWVTNPTQQAIQGSIGIEL